MKAYPLAFVIVASALLLLLGCVDVEPGKKCREKGVVNLTGCGFLGLEGTKVVYSNSSGGFEFYTADGDVIGCPAVPTNSTSKECRDLIAAMNGEYCSDENICDEYKGAAGANTTLPGRTSAPPK